MAKSTTNKTAIVPKKKKTSQGNGQFSKASNKKGATKKRYRGQGK